ncbi:MAG: sodium:solute symporter [Flavobacteriaceae bacterium]|nr:sodium:solute symporter [Flavobacteriaceae bacterium]MCY4267931.1 sodium:solute symporter [Flavobacteriaceae bacterium]
MSVLDWVVLLGTIGFIIGFGIWKNHFHRNISDYLKAGNSARWWTVGLSVMATQASAITFLSTPGQAYHDGMGFVQFYFGLPIAMVIICLFFIPIYHKLKVYTVYEYLENRFDLKTRTLTAILFLIQRGLAAGITIFAPSIVLSVVLGWNLNTVVIIVGLLVIVYTSIGGTKAVNVTQKWQMAIIFLGMFLAFGYIIYSFPNELNFHKALEIAGLSGKLEVIDFSFDLENRYTFWTGIIGGSFLALSYFGTDQSQAQRYLSGKSIQHSQMGLLMNGFLKVPMQFFILLVGVMVFLFYQIETAPIHYNPQNLEMIRNSDQAETLQALEANHLNLQNEIKQLLLNPNLSQDENLQNELIFLEYEEKNKREQTKDLIKIIDNNAEVNDKDYVFISFILGNLPKGFIGLLLAVIFCAAMSSTASEINALSATATVDLYRRRIRGKSDQHYLNASKIFTVFWGLIAIGFASIGYLFENLIQLVNIIGSLFYGAILGVFLLAFFFKHIKSRAAFISVLLSELLVLLIFYLDIISYLWLNVMGALLCILLAHLFQFFLKLKT